MPIEPEVILEEDQPIEIDLGEDDDALAQAQAQEQDVGKDKPDDVAADLTKQIEALKAANKQQEDRAVKAERTAMEALQYAQQREQQTYSEYQHRLASESETVQSGLAAAQSDQENAKKDLMRAREDGDVDKETDAIARISRAAQDIRQYEYAISSLAEQQRQQAVNADRQRQQQTQPQRQQQPRQLTEQELLDRAKTSNELMPQEKEWLDKHPELITNKSMNRELEVAYRGATRQGLVRGTPEYFAHLNNVMGYQENEGRQNMGSRVSAPVTQRATSNTNKGPQSVKLTERDIEIANGFGFRSQEQLKSYARNKLNVPNRMKELNGDKAN